MTAEQIEQIVDMLAEKLGPIGAEVWAVYVRQVYVGIAESAFVALLCLVGAAALSWLTRHLLRKRAKAGSYDQIDYEFALMFVLGALAFIVVVGGCAALGLFRLLNPEYYAIQMLLGR